MNVNVAIGERIKNLRKYHSITQNALANYLGVSNQAVSKWENSVSMPDLCLIPDIATYFGITIDELFKFNPNKSREMQVDMYFHALYHLITMSNMAKKNGLLILRDYINVNENEVNPMIQESVNLICDAFQSEHISLYLKNKGKNDYMFSDENYIDCIVTGVKCINDGCNTRVLELLLMSYLPKNIIEEVSEKIKKALETDV